MKNFEELISIAKLTELINTKKEDEQCKKVLWALAIIGAIAAVAGIAAIVYKFLSPDYVDDFEDDFDDDDFEEVEEAPAKKEEAPEATEE